MADVEHVYIGGPLDGQTVEGEHRKSWRIIVPSVPRDFCYEAVWHVPVNGRMAWAEIAIVDNVRRAEADAFKETVAVVAVRHASCEEGLRIWVRWPDGSKSWDWLAHWTNRFQPAPARCPRCGGTRNRENDKAVGLDPT